MSTTTRVNGRLRALAGLRIEDDPGRFAMIDKHKLLVDSSYQRGEKLAKQKRMAAEWSWVACGALVAGHRAGKFYVFDGQQRLGAAKMLAGIVEMPCMVYETLRVEEEAGAFLRINTGRTAVMAVEAFQARLTKREPVAVELQAMLDEHGYSVSVGGRFNKAEPLICSIARFLKEMEKDSGAIKRVFPIAIRVAKVGFIDHKLIAGLCYLERSLAAVGNTLVREACIKNLVEAGRVRIEQDMYTQEAANGRNPASWSEAIRRIANKGLRQNKLETPVA